MNQIKYLYLKWRINRDENFLLEEGIREAKKRKLEIDLGSEGTLSLDNAEGSIYLQDREDGKVNSTELVALGAQNHPKVADRYLANKKQLKSK